MIEVVCKRAFDAKRRGRRVQIGFQRKVKKDADAKKKLYYVNGGKQERKSNFIKRFFHLYISGGTQEWKFNFIKKNFLRYNNKSFAPALLTYKRDWKNHHLQTVHCNISPAHCDERQLFLLFQKKKFLTPNGMWNLSNWSVNFFSLLDWKYMVTST